MSFPTVNPSLDRALTARDYLEPTAVQSAVLVEEAQGRDLLVSAQTGSGKTVAYGLAFAPTLLGEAERFDRPAAPLALAIAPTREAELLATDVSPRRLRATERRVREAAPRAKLRALPPSTPGAIR